MLRSYRILPETGHVSMSVEDLCGLVFSAAGVASVPFMRDHPHYVMPSEEIKEGVSKVLFEQTGIDTSEVEGYRG